MKLKNFIEVTLYVDSNATREKNLINIKNIIRIQKCRIYLKDGSDFLVEESASKIQQKIFECQNYDFINSIINGEGTDENVKGLKPEHQEIIKPYNKPNTTKTGSQKPF